MRELFNEIEILVKTHVCAQTRTRHKLQLLCQSNNHSIFVSMRSSDEMCSITIIARGDKPCVIAVFRALSPLLQIHHNAPIALVQQWRNHSAFCKPFIFGNTRHMLENVIVLRHRVQANIPTHSTLSTV